MKIRADLHIHTRYSPDSIITFPQLVKRCGGKGIDVVAILDHDTVEGALDFRDQSEALRLRGEWAPRIIVGEEIRSSKGEIAGLFIKERVDHHMTPRETMEAIKSQGGVVYIPHPFDYLKIKRLRADEILQYGELIDVVEVFNGKPRYPGANSRAERFLERHPFPGGAGSDAHEEEHIGAVTLEMEEFEGPEDFINKLWGASIRGKRYSPLSSAYYQLQAHLRKR